MRFHFGTLLLSAIIAMVLWGMAHGTSSIERSVDIPVVFDDVPDDVVITSRSVDVVNVRVLGSRAALRNVSPTKLDYRIDISGAQPGPAGYELDFIRQVNRESILYSEELNTAGDRGSNKIEYPDTTLAGQLALIARLIDGGMKSRVYLVSQRGYDTHSNQLERHSNLMGDLNDAILAFQQDITALGHGDRVLGMTVSEFGRRVEENGSAGTDHGTSAPIFLFGSDLKAGILGPDSDFSRIDDRGDFFHTYDFRQVYASVLSQWFEIPEAVTQTILPTATAQLPIIRPVQIDASDFNNDGIVDFQDFLQFADGFQRGDTRFDIDGDGETGFSDFLEFARAFGRRRSS